ncbi:MAG: hypothetical protein GQ532_12190 [Methylomarinum sp.]|nr:hypothetical protein [Methylomarinum sp.]
MNNQDNTNRSVVTLPTNTELLSGKLTEIDSCHKVITTNSLKVADHFDKRPADVNRKISKLIKNGVCNFTPSYYLNLQGKQQIYYPLNRDQFLQIVFGFTGNKAEQFHASFIQAFNQQEAELKEWKKKRQSVIEPTKSANNSIEWLRLELIKETPESRKPQFLYINIQSAITKAATKNARTNRNEMTANQLNFIQCLEIYVHQEIERMRGLELSAVEIRKHILDILKAGCYEQEEVVTV